MAYSFLSSSSQYLRANSSPLGTGQLSDHTISFWVKAPAVFPATTILSISRSTETTSTNNPAILIQINSIYIRYFLRANSSPDGFGWMITPGSSGQTVFNNTWKHCACRLINSTTVSTASTYVDGALNETSTYNSPTPQTTGMDRLGIGALIRGNVLSYSTATIAEVAVWSTAISVDEISSLAKGVSSSMVRPQSLVFYAPLLRNLSDMRNALTITNNNSATITDHQRIYL